MRLSQLKTGERGVIVKVLGHGGFRKRIVEMGFIKGKMIEVLLNAPLKDPVKYKLLGYEISLRHDEAEMIEVISVEEAAEIERKQHKMEEDQSTELLGIDQQQNIAYKLNSNPSFTSYSHTSSTSLSADTLTDNQLREAALAKHRIINVALR